MGKKHPQHSMSIMMNGTLIILSIVFGLWILLEKTLPKNSDDSIALLTLWCMVMLLAIWWGPWLNRSDGGN